MTPRELEPFVLSASMSLFPFSSGSVLSDLSSLILVELSNFSRNLKASSFLLKGFVPLVNTFFFF